jgi:hypothetical protein
VTHALRLTGAVLGGLLLAATAGCGGSDQPAPLTGKDKTAAENLSREFQKSGLNAHDGDCVSQRWVRKVGAATMVKAGLLDSTLKPATTSKAPSKPIVTAYVDAYFSCVDYGKIEAIKFDTTRPNTIDKVAFAACATKIDKGQAKQAMTDDLLQKSSKTSASVTSALLKCANG